MLYSLEMNKSADTLVLCGSSLNGIVLLGSLQYLEDNEYLNCLEKYVGTSSGALICYFLSIGYKPTEIMVNICIRNIIEKIQTLDMGGVFRGTGGISFMVIQEEIERATISKIGYLPTMGDIKNKFNKELYIKTYNITKNRDEYLSWETTPELPCITALRMSCNIPFIFENFKYGESFYIDGGITGSFPIEMGVKLSDNIIGFYISTQSRDDIQIPEMGILDYFYKLINLPLKQISNVHIKNCKKEGVEIFNIKPFSNVKLFSLKMDPKYKLDMFIDGYCQMEKLNIQNSLQKEKTDDDE